MRKDIAKVWVDALRSGKYKQGTEALCRDEKYCCLGVLCELYTQDNECRVVDKVSYGSETTTRWYEGCHDVLPTDVIEWAGMSSHIGSYFDPEVDHEFSLAELNDEGYKFPRLADIIEVNWETL